MQLLEEDDHDHDHDHEHEHEHQGGEEEYLDVSPEEMQAIDRVYTMTNFSW